MYLPDLPEPAYQELLTTPQREFTYTFGGATIVRDLEGSYLSNLGQLVKVRINVIYSDIGLTFGSSIELLGGDVNELRRAGADALNEEAVLIVVMRVFHAG